MGEFLFDLYTLFVVNMFGSIIVSVFAIAGLIAVIFLVCKVRPNILVIWLMFYFIVMSTMSMGGLALLFAYLIVGTTFVWQVIGFFADRKQI